MTSEALHEDPSVCTRMLHATCNRPPALNNGFLAAGQLVHQWHTLPTRDVPEIRFENISKGKEKGNRENYLDHFAQKKIIFPNINR